MTLFNLLTKEIKQQKLNFGLGVLAILAAAGVLVAELTVLNAHDQKTRAILEEKEARTAKEMAVMEDDYRKIMKELGFNLLILPRGQRLDEYYATGYVTNYMPEGYAHSLASAGLMTIRHLLPSLEERITWPEKGGREIILAGIRGEIPTVHKTPEEPILEAVHQGEMVVGYELGRSLALKAGDKVRLKGQDFLVREVYSERGSKDDITVWIDLAKAQEMLGKKGLINAILALKCICVGNELSQVRQDVARILPETQVIEVESKVVTRAEARERARITAERALVAERENRGLMRAEMEYFAAWLIPLVMIGSAVWIALLALGNVRARRGEIAILRALGLRSGQILLIFLGKAVLLGLFGGVLGYAAGFAMGLAAGESGSGIGAAWRLFHPGLFFMVVLTAPLLAGLASWVPALVAARIDPAEILREE
jgi:hypothetical protein